MATPGARRSPGRPKRPAAPDFQTSDTFRKLDNLSELRYVEFITLKFSTPGMALPSHKTKFPTGFLADQQIAYVTDNHRDAEAIRFTIDSPVVIRRRRESALGAPLLSSTDGQPSRPSQTSGRPKLPDGSDVEGISAALMSRR